MDKNHTIIMLGLGKPKGAPPKLGPEENEYAEEKRSVPAKKVEAPVKSVCTHTDICPFYKPGTECGEEEEHEAE